LNNRGKTVSEILSCNYQMKTTTINWKNTHKAFQKIKTAKKILLVAHEHPDGDALSSVCLFIDLLNEMGISYYAYCKNMPSSNFYFLSGVETVSDKKPDFSSFDIIITLDCGDIKRTNLTEEINNRSPRQCVIEFDHHPKITDYANIEIRDSKASATTEILYGFCKDNGIKMNKNRATSILTGIATDTGNFIYPSTSEQTIAIASEMLIHGAQLPHILSNTWRNKSLTTMKVWGEAINNLKINEKYGIAYSVLAKDSLTNIEVSDEDLEGIAGFLGNLEKINALLFLRESEDGLIKGSLRTSQENIDVSRIARFLGGGGHAKASGFKLKANLSKTDNGWMVN
jgi:phosphoesterase RecJ-like protein